LFIIRAVFADAATVIADGLVKEFFGAEVVFVAGRLESKESVEVFAEIHESYYLSVFKGKTWRDRCEAARNEGNRLPGRPRRGKY
jgi:hypothetical protein